MTSHPLSAIGPRWPRLAGLVMLAAIAGGLAAIPLNTVQSAAPTKGDTIEIGPDLLVDVQVSGRVLQIQASPSSSPTLILNPDAAEQIGMGQGMFGAKVNVGPTAITGRTAVLTYDVGGMSDKKRAVAFARAIAPDHDGTIGPKAFPQQRVVYRLREASQGERIVSLPMADDGFAGTGTMIRIAGENLFVKWALHRRATIATAGAAADIAEANNGRLEGEPWRELIAFDVKRPVRQMKLNDPLMIGLVSLNAILARTADYGNTSGIAEAEAEADANADASEILVRGKGKSSGQTRRVLEIGSDAMQHCSSLTFDKAARTIILSCR